MRRSPGDIRHYYELLDLPSTASRAEVEQAYREMAKIWHPDRFSDDARLRKRTEQKMKEINRAREEILAHLDRGGSRMGSADGGAPGPRPVPTPIEHLLPLLMRYGIPLLLILFSMFSRVPIVMAFALILLVVVLVFLRRRG